MELGEAGLGNTGGLPLLGRLHNPGLGVTVEENCIFLAQHAYVELPSL